MFSRIYKYHHELNSYDVVKFLAIITMVIDHIGFYFVVENTEYWRTIGRFAAPLFFFMSGYVSKYHIKPNILFYGIFITVAGFILGYGFSINILIVIVCIKWVLEHWDPSQENVVTLVIIFALLYFFSFLLIGVIDYGLFGFAYAFCGRLLAMKANQVLVSSFLFGTLYSQLYDLIIFNENLYVATEALIVTIILLFLMALFKYKVFFIKSLFKNGILIFSRYSLEIYFWHLLLFEIVFQLRRFF